MCRDPQIYLALEMVSVSISHAREFHINTLMNNRLELLSIYRQGKDRLLDKWCRKNWISTHKRMKLDPYLTLHTKNNSKYIKDVNVRPKTIPRRKHKENILDINLGNEFLGMTPKAQATKAKINEWD